MERVAASSPPVCLLHMYCIMTLVACDATTSHLPGRGPTSARTNAPRLGRKRAPAAESRINSSDAVPRSKWATHD